MKGKYLLVTLLLFISIHYLSAQTIQGKVIDPKTKEPMPGASVSLKNTSYATVTDVNGNYKINNVPPGEYNIVVTFIGYEAINTKIKVTSGEVRTLNFNPTEKATNLSDVTVVGKLNQEEEEASRLSEKTASNIITVISAKAMERSPDINVANVLQRMSGVNILRSNGSDGAFAVIRGLEPRYNNTLVNGIKIASPDEKNRFVPLDIIPSDLLKRIEITKALTPNMEGDAIGGTVNLVMKDAPDTTLLKVSGADGYSQLFLDRKFDTFDKSAIQKKSIGETKPEGYNAIPSDFPLSNVIPTKKQSPATYTAGITYGKRIINNKLGFIVSVNTQNQFYGSDGIFQVPTNKDNITTPILISAPRFTSNHQRNSGVIFHIDYIINNKNKIGLYNVFLKSDLDQVRTNVDTNLRDQRSVPGTGSTHLISRTLSNTQVVENLKLDGKHQLSQNLLLDWGLVFSNAYKKAPDRSTLDVDITGTQRYDSVQHKFVIKYSPLYYDSNTRLWQHNDDKDYTGLLNLSYQPKVFDKYIDFKAGVFYRTKSRNNRQNSYTLKASSDPVTGGKAIYTNIYNQSFYVFNNQGSYQFDYNNYNADEQVSAAYFQGKTEFGLLEILAGLRAENTHQRFTTKKLDYVTGVLKGENITYLDFLPSLHLKYHIDKNQNLRFSYFKALSRPNYFELIPYFYQGTDFNEIGNPELKHTTAHNLDLRYEIFANGEDYFGFGVFYKNLTNPIEYQIQGASFIVDNGKVIVDPYGSSGFSGGQITYKPVNIPSAINSGLELTFAKYYKNFGITGNYTYTHSAVQDRKVGNFTTASIYKRDTSLFLYEKRTLQGQSPHTANAALIYRSVKNGIYIQLSYQFSGKTLRAVSPFYNVDYYQAPQSTLALSGEKNLKKHFILFVKLNNILNTKTTYTSLNSDIIIQQDTFKQSYLLGLRYIL